MPFRRQSKWEKAGFIDITNPGKLSRAKQKAIEKAQKAITRNPTTDTPLVKGGHTPGKGKQEIPAKKPKGFLIKKTVRSQPKRKK